MLEGIFEAGIGELVIAPIVLIVLGAFALFEVSAGRGAGPGSRASTRWLR